LLLQKGGTIFDHILLAIDSSESALQAAKVAGDLARAVQTKELQIVIAHEPVPTYSGEQNLQNPMNTRLDKSQEIVQGAEDAVGNVPAAVYSELIEGQITETVIHVAKTRRSDLIIMGAQGLGRLAGALLGINAQKVVSEAPCPVLIVR
jgi:nucleotide-binding universal stress UspA family protein